MNLALTLWWPKIFVGRANYETSESIDKQLQMARRPLVSVIIPAYNEAVGLGETLESLNKIRQTEYLNLEVIVAVNGSNDATELVARRQADKVFVLTERNAAEARNIGAHAAMGEILIFLDADNQVGPNVISQLVNLVKSDTVGTCSSYPSIVYLKSFVISKLKNFVHALGLVRGANGLVFCHQDLFTKHGLEFDPKIKLGEFHDFIYRARKKIGARYTYVKIRGGCRVSVDRYEKIGYFKNFLFWARFTCIVHLFGARCIFKHQADPTPFEREYWQN